MSRGARTGVEARGAVASRWRRGRGPAAHRGGGPAAARRWRRGWRRLDVVVAAGDGGQHGTTTRRGGAARRDGEDGEATRRHGEEGHDQHGRLRSSSSRSPEAFFVDLPKLGNETPKSRAKTGLWYRLEPPTGTKGLLVPVGGSNR